MESTGSNAGISPLDELQRQLAEDLAQVVAAPTPQPSTNLVATTVSTIVLQGGPLQLVIALLKVSHRRLSASMITETCARLFPRSS